MDINVKDIMGISEVQAAERLKTDGYNELPSAKRKSIFNIAFEVVKEPMFILLVSCGVIYLFLGDKEEALMLLGFVFIVMGITFYQERKTERALEALKDLSSPRALVIRDGVQHRIAGREVVVGDMVVLSEGDRIPADGVVIWNNNLSCDESLLTGESVPVNKSTGKSNLTMDRPGGDDLPFIFSGSMSVHGQAVVEIKSTGLKTEIGKIGAALHSLEQDSTRLQKEINSLVKKVAVVGVFLCVLVFVVYGLSRADWLKGFLAGLSLAMAILPEEFPVVLTIFFALGAWRISKKRVLTRRVPVIETLGSATVLCVDKTGTLTMNKMTIEMIYTNKKLYDISGGLDFKKSPEVKDIVETGIMACQKDPFDPMEKAFKELGKSAGLDCEKLFESMEFVREYPLSKKMLALSHAFKRPSTGSYFVASKGAPEAIMDMCHMEPNDVEFTMSKVNEMASKGYRVLGVAIADYAVEKLPDDQHDFIFRFAGLVGLADPVRPQVKTAVAECYSAGIRVVMITGDYPATAANIAQQIGLRNKDNVITGKDLDTMPEAQIIERMKETNIFARVVPEQKLKIVNMLKMSGEVVAMTGDGVNDAPALKAADIGIAMGARGTDVARESASLVLLDDDFESIAAAVKMGRRIFDNLKKALSYIVSVHVPIAGLSLLPVLFKWPLIMMPVHIVFLELIIDPACSTVFEAEPEEKDVMKRKPRNKNDSVFGVKPLVISLLQGFVVLGVVLTVFIMSGKLHASENEARTMAFATVVFSNICMILTNLSWTRNVFEIIRDPNPAMWWVISGALALITSVLYIPGLRTLFGFGILHLNDLLICIAAGFFSIAWFEIAKVMMKKKTIMA
ncbi:MAG: cation-translocating P-type ATPase [bacterium]